ncbi:hypothetical protein BTS2_2816 [Bacillus sp. TS-2]|nr:hypothetical protein BTS2_2816 [Bacillus sp. TS-2]
MPWAILALLIFAILLIILSYFREDRTKTLAKELDELTITHMQDVYQLKKRLSELESQIILPDKKKPAHKKTARAKLTEDVFFYYTKGYTLEQIASKTNLTKDEVTSIMKNDKI